jgi:hypothetical protein
MSLLAQAAEDGMVNGEADLADFFFLAAFIVFTVACILCVVILPRTIWAALVSAGLALVALGWFVL